MEKEEDIFLTKNLKAKKFKEICQFFHQKNLEEFYLYENGVEVTLKNKNPVQPEYSTVPIFTPPPTANPSTVKNEEKTNNEPKDESLGIGIESPIAGTFYSSASPDTPPFIQEGDKVKKGQVIAIIEAMKIMNEITSPHNGTVKQIIVKNGESVSQGKKIILLT